MIHSPGHFVFRVDFLYWVWEDLLMDIGTSVRIIEDEYPQLVGVVGVVERVSDDGTVAWVATEFSGVWCSISLLEEVE